MELPDIAGLSSLQSLLTNLTGFSLALYNRKGDVVLPPVREDHPLSARASRREEYGHFLRTNIEKAMLRTEISWIKSPTGQWHFFAPLREGDAVLTIVGDCFDHTTEDYACPVPPKERPWEDPSGPVKSTPQAVRVRNHPAVQETARHIRSAFSSFLKGSYMAALHEKRYRLVKTVMAMIPEITPDKTMEEVYGMLADILLFFFNAESLSVMIKDEGIFSPLRAEGRFKDHLLALPFQATGVIAQVVENRKPSYSEESMDILRLGLPDEVTALHVFPVLQGSRVAGLVALLNAVLQQEETDIISDLCRIFGSLLGFIELKNVCNKYLREIDVLNAAATRLITVKEPDMLYEAILDTSVRLTEAEKGSLMLVDDTSALTIKAAKGINKRLLGEIKIRPGEGIAGRVLQDGTPLFIDDIERNANGFYRRPKYRTGSFISIPLKIGEETIGVLNISDKITGEVFSEEDLSLLRSFASYASIALERSTYYSLAGQLKELSITDSLTGLFNRRYFEERFIEELHRSGRHNLSFSLAMIDIDDFKLFNDTEGHLAGDEVLKYIANSAKECLRVSDVIARFGGEEFAVIMPQTEKDEAFLVAERIRTAVKEQLPCARTAFPRDAMTVSIGISTFPYDGKERKELIRHADKALYRAKMEGKDRTVPWEG
jgi:diguanylate cyclase (GGDEF)-like protein